MNAVIDLSAVEEQLVNCKVGDEYSVSFIVDVKTPKELTGTASEIEHVNEEYDDEDRHEDLDVEGHREGAKKGKLPKAILMVAK